MKSHYFSIQFVKVSGGMLHCWWQMLFWMKAHSYPSGTGSVCTHQEQLCECCDIAKTALAVQGSVSTWNESSEVESPAVL